MLVKILLVLLGLVLGVALNAYSWSRDVVGTLHRTYDPEEPETPYLYLEIHREKASKIEHGRYIVLEVRDDEKVVRLSQK